MSLFFDLSLIQATLILKLNLLMRLLFRESLERSRCFFLLESHEVLCELSRDFNVFEWASYLSIFSSFNDFSNYSSSSFSNSAFISNSTFLFSYSCFSSDSYPAKNFCPSCLQYNFPFYILFRRHLWWMKWPHGSFRRKDFCGSLHIMHYNYYILMSSFLHYTTFQRLFFEK